MRTLEFMPATSKVLRLLAEEPAEFAAQHGIRLHEVAQQVAQHSLEFLKSFPYETRPAYLGFLVVDGTTQEMVGVCSFKGPPTEGVIEIAYFTFPGFEGRGIATEMARYLMKHAGTLPDVSLVIAHTVPERNASTRVLEKLGMKLAGEEEEDGVAVWRWEMRPLKDIGEYITRHVLDKDSTFFGG